MASLGEMKKRRCAEKSDRKLPKPMPSTGDVLKSSSASRWIRKRPFSDAEKKSAECLNRKKVSPPATSSRAIKIPRGTHASVRGAPSADRVNHQTCQTNAPAKNRIIPARE